MTANTLAEQLQDAYVSFADLNRQYRPLLKLVEQLIGVVPNCDPILEIWPPGFKTYNLLVPNMLNLPLSLVGQSAPKDLVGLAMYQSSRAADCMYCSAHTCSFALRRGVSPEALVGRYSDPAEEAVARLAERMATIPASLAPQDVRSVRAHLSKTDTEWVAMGVAMMGFLNKFMDTMGVELEQGAIDDVGQLITETGWRPGKHVWTAEDVDIDLGQSGGRPLGAPAPENERPAYLDVPQDSLSTYLSVLRQAPAALRLDKRWTKGMTGRTGDAISQLEDELGVAYGPLGNVNLARPMKALSAVIMTNLDPKTTQLGLDAKILIGLVYADVVGNDVLKSNNIQLAEQIAPKLGYRKMTAVSSFARQDLAQATLPPGLTTVEAAATMLAKAAAPSPSEVSRISIDHACHSLTPAQIVEAVVWLSVQQALHRLHVFYEASLNLDSDSNGA